MPNLKQKNNTSLKSIKKTQSKKQDYTYVLYDDITPDTMKQMFFDFDKLGVREIDTLYFILCSNGGSPSCAYEMSYYMRNYTNKVVGLFPSYVYSSAVLLSLSFDELHFGSFGFFGPMDTQSPNYMAEIGFEYDSTENIDACYNAIIDYGVKAMDRSVRKIMKRTKLSSADSVKLSKHMVDAVVQPVLSQIDPNTLGAYHRASDLASMYGVRILSDIMNIDTSKAWDMCYGLIKRYPTHGFHIKQNELKLIDLPVKTPSISVRNTLDTMKFRLDEKDNFQGFIDGRASLNTMNKIAA